MDVKGYVSKLYMDYLRENDIPYSERKLDTAISQFDIEAVDTFVNKDINEYETYSERAERERYHRKNLRVIVGEYCEKIIAQHRKGKILTEAYFSQSRLDMKADGRCDLYPC